mgnify:FL=1
MIFVVLIVCLLLLILGLTKPTWPSKAQLCRDVEGYLPNAECIRQENALAIVMQAFPEGEVSSSDVKSALGKYLQDEHPTTYGHVEEYRLGNTPIKYLFSNFASYRFRYDNKGILIAFDYYD